MAKIMHKLACRAKHVSHAKAVKAVVVSAAVAIAATAQIALTCALALQKASALQRLWPLAASLQVWRQPPALAIMPQTAQQAASKASATPATLVKMLAWPGSVVSAARVIAMAVIAGSVAASVAGHLSTAHKIHLKANFLIKISQQPAQNLHTMLLNL